VFGDGRPMANHDRDRNQMTSDPKQVTAARRLRWE
jgi:hypothetical protein